MPEMTIDFNNEQDKRDLYAVLRTRKGVHTVSVKRKTKHRSLKQNAYLWGVVLPYAASAMTEAWGETFDADGAHEYLKREFLSRPVVNRSTGEIVGHRTGSTAELTTERFAEYIDTVCKWCAEYLGVEIPEPNERQNNLTAA